MFRIVSLIALMLTSLCSLASATIRNVPGQYATIQAGINAGVTGDTILVQRGIYLEQLNFNGHRVTLGSLYLTTGDTTNIHATLIDAESLGTVITFNHGEDSTTAVVGFTIQHGNNEYGGGGGISCNAASPAIRNNIINGNVSAYGGGGIYCINSNSLISRNQIINNSSGFNGFPGNGGGLNIRGGNVKIIENAIINNRAGMLIEPNDGFGGGVFCNLANTVIVGNLIKGNQGSMGAGGMALVYGKFVVSNNIVIENSCAFSRGGKGGGIHSGDSTLLDNNCIIDNNADIAGGGLACTAATKVINNCIVGNHAGTTAGGLYYEGNPIITNTIIRGNTADSNANIEGWGGFPTISYCDIEGGWLGPGNMDVDPLFRDPANGDYRLMSFNCGNNRNSPCIDVGNPAILDTLLECSFGLGLPLSDIGAYGGGYQIQQSVGRIIIPIDYPTIQLGINASNEDDTIIVMPGTYFENIHTTTHNIVLGSMYLLTGDLDYIDATTIDGQLAGPVIYIQTGLDSTSVICGFTICHGRAGWGGGINCESSHPIIRNNIIRDNFGYHEYGGVGGGINCYNSRASIVDNIITNNTSNDVGGGISYMESSGGKIINNMVIGNSATGNGGGGIFLTYANPLIQDNTITENVSGYFGGGIYCRYNNNNPIIRNSIIWGNVAASDSNFSIDSTSTVTISYCDIGGGWAGIGNFDTDPLFRNPIMADYHVMAISCGDSLNSPCIDTGDPVIIDSILSCAWGLGTERSDIGACGGRSITPLVGIVDEPVNIPQQFLLSQSYPNPFNPTTTISYTLPKACIVSLEIYDILGRKVETLVNREEPAGPHQAVWNARDNASGIYFYLLNAGNIADSKRMLLLK